MVQWQFTYTIIRINIYFIYPYCYFMSLSLIISNFISFDHHVNLIT